MDDSSLRIIVGPTAAGKSALALSLAREFGAAIVSADSRQIYRGFDIGTGKPTAAEQAAVPHRGVDVAAPSERWSAARFAAEAGAWIDLLRADGREPVVVGGTGFWIDALVAPLSAVPALDPAAREALGRALANLSHDEVHAWCAALDPLIALRGHAQWRRAIEVALLTGRRLSDWHADQPRTPARDVRYLLVDLGPALESRIAERVDTMFAQGWMDEVRALSAHVPAAAVAWKACGYERVRHAVESAGDAGAVRADVVRETRQYARRQRTWFRRQLQHGPVTLIDPGAPDALDRARRWWTGDISE